MTNPSDHPGSHAEPANSDLLRYLHGEIENQDELTRIEERLRSDHAYREEMDHLALADAELVGLFSRDPELTNLASPQRERIIALLRSKPSESTLRSTLLRFAPVVLGGLAATFVIGAMLFPTVGGSIRPLGEVTVRSSQITSGSVSLIELDRSSSPSEFEEVGEDSTIAQISIDELKAVELPSPTPATRAIGGGTGLSNERGRLSLSSSSSEAQSRQRTEGNAALESLFRDSDTASATPPPPPPSPTFRFQSRETLDVADAFAPAPSVSTRPPPSVGGELHSAGSSAPSRSFRAKEFAESDLQPAPVGEPAADLLETEAAPVSQSKFKTALPFDPVSTFALNVSDRSFRLAADVLARNQLPPPDQIQPEEFLNALHYGDPAPTPTEKVGLQWDLAEDPFRPGGHLLRLNIQTAGQGNRNPGPLDLILLIDNSGSMQRRDRKLTLNAFTLGLGESLPPNARLELRTIDGRQTFRFRKTVNPDILVTTLNHLATEPGLEAPLSVSLQAAFDQHHRNRQPNASQRVVVLTDGIGLPDPTELTQLRRQIDAAANNGITLDLVLISPEPSGDSALENLIKETDGSFLSLYPATENIPDLAANLAGRFRPSARDAKVQVVFNPARVASYQLIGYEKHRLRAEDFRNDQIDGGELAAAEEGNALYALELQPNGVGPIAEVRVRFQDTATGLARERNWEIPLVGTPPAITGATPAMQLATAATHFATRLQNRLDASGAPLSRIEKLATSNAHTFSRDPEFQQLLTMIRTARTLFNE